MELAWTSQDSRAMSQTSGALAGKEREGSSLEHTWRIREEGKLATHTHRKSLSLVLHGRGHW